MGRLIFGVETEYGFTALGANGEALDRSEYVQLLVHQVGERHAHLNGSSGTSLFLENGARFYAEIGAHPEYATPECTSPEELVACMRAGNQLLQEAARDLQTTRPGVELVIFRGNTDYADPGVTWGSHESMLYHTSPEVMTRNLVPHLVSRIVYCGAGGLDASSDGIVFTISPRARFVKQLALMSQGQVRAFFHGKNEPLGGPGLRRLQVVCGESLCCEWADYLRVGTTALIAALVDAGNEIGVRVQLEKPFTALHQLAADTECRASFKLTSGRTATAIEVQRHYLEQVRMHLGARFLPEWAAKLCRRWEETLDRLEQDPATLWRRLDWPLKRMLFRDRALRRGFSWGRVTDASRGRVLELPDPCGEMRPRWKGLREQSQRERLMAELFR